MVLARDATTQVVVARNLSAISDRKVSGRGYETFRRLSVSETPRW